MGSASHAISSIRSNRRLRTSFRKKKRSQIFYKGWSVPIGGDTALTKLQEQKHLKISNKRILTELLKWTLISFILLAIFFYYFNISLADVLSMVR